MPRKQYCKPNLITLPHQIFPVRQSQDPAGTQRRHTDRPGVRTVQHTLLRYCCGVLCCSTTSVRLVNNASNAVRGTIDVASRNSAGL
jgi:hypothetical protein